jgi:hypothetical protein
MEIRRGDGGAVDLGLHQVTLHHASPWPRMMLSISRSTRPGQRSWRSCPAAPPRPAGAPRVRREKYTPAGPRKHREPGAHRRFDGGGTPLAGRPGLVARRRAAEKTGGLLTILRAEVRVPAAQGEPVRLPDRRHHHDLHRPVGSRTIFRTRWPAECPSARSTQHRARRGETASPRR